MVKLLETIIAIALVTCAVFEDVLVCVYSYYCLTIIRSKYCSRVFSLLDLRI